MTMKEEHIPEITESKLYDDVCAIIEDTRYRVAVYVNSEACRMNWHVGMRIKEDVLHNARAEYGKQVVKHLAERLVKRYGSGWGFKKLQHCLRAAYTFSEAEIDYAVRRQLSWTHLRSLMFVVDELARKFYMEMRVEDQTGSMSSISDASSSSVLPSILKFSTRSIGLSNTSFRSVKWLSEMIPSPTLRR